MIPPAIVWTLKGSFDLIVQGKKGIQRRPALRDISCTVLEALFEYHLEEGEVCLPNDHEVVQWLFTQGGHLSTDHAKVVSSFPQAAQKGDAKAQYYLGTMYWYGIGIAKDEAKAVLWFRKAAEQGHARAEYALGAMCLYGIGGIALNQVEAAMWFHRSAEQGYRDAQYELSEMYLDGIGVFSDADQEVF